jgi:hypothetical protein
MLVYGTFPHKGKKSNSKRGVEMYDHDRYFTVTGNLFAGSPLEIKAKGAELHNLHQTLLGDVSYQERVDPRQTALTVLPFISGEMAVDYNDWLGVGMALHSVSDDLLNAWDEWSRKCSEKYVDGECAKKWQGFTKGGGLQVGSLVHWAKLNGYDPKKHRPITTAPTNGAATNGRHSPPLTESAKTAAAADHAPMDPLSWLRSFGVDVLRVIKIGSKRGVFDMELRTGETIQLGTTDDILNPGRVQAAIADAIRIVIPLLKRNDWRPIGAEIIRIAEHVDVDADPQAELSEMIEGFTRDLGNKVCVTEAEAIDSVNSTGAARGQDGSLYIGLTKFMGAILALNPSRFTRADIIQRLYRAGFKKTRLVQREGQKVKQAKTWKGSHEFV